jgi:exopolysaccharide biosynthesis protein
LVWALAATAASAAQVITEPFLGVRLIHQTETLPRPLNIYVAEIDLAAAGIGFQMTPRSPMYPGPQINGAPAETIRETTRNFADAVGAQLAINAAFYAAITQNGTLWANNVGLTASNGDKYSPWDAFANPPESKDWFDNYFHDAINISQTNQVTFVKMPENTGDGFQTLPSTTLYNTVTGQYRLIQNNNVKADLPATSPDPRTAVGVTAASKLLLVTVDGRQAGFSEGLTIIELANLMKNTYGAANAIVLDGGGSTTMAMNFYNDATSSQVLNSPSDGNERLVGSNLAVFALPNGDYNQNGLVDAGDYIEWRKSIGGQMAYDAWRYRFGNAAGAVGSAATVPELSAAKMALLISFIAMGGRICLTRRPLRAVPHTSIELEI